MYPAVEDAFWTESKKLEGRVLWPYLDNKGLVTCAIGYLVDNGSGQAPPEMLALPWKHLSGETMTIPEIQAAWHAVKARQDLKGIGGGNDQFANLTDARLDDAGVEMATERWILQKEPILRKYFPGYDTFQADGQLGIMLLAYALGAAFAPGFPKFTAAVNALPPQWLTAQKEGVISTHDNPQVAARDADIAVLFGNAAQALHSSVPYNVLWWPGTSAPSGSGPSSGNGPGGGGLATAFSSPAPLFGRVLLGLLVFGAGALGVATYRSVQRGDPWTRAPRQFARRVTAAEARVESQVRQALRLGSGTRA